MRTELVRIDTSGDPVDGLWHIPEDGPGRAAVLLMHGNVGNFYTGPSRFLPEHLTRAGFACLAFNRRGHDILVNRFGRRVGGGAFQTTREGFEDNEAAAAFVASKGFDEPIVVGHSNGGMLGAHFAAAHPEVTALVLLSAQRGGARNDRVGPPNVVNGAPLLAGERHEEALAEAERLVAAGRPHELMLVPGWWRVISAESLVDRAYRTPETVAAAPRVSCPVLYLRGEHEPAEVYPAEAFSEACGGSCDVVIAPGCDHWYSDNEDMVATVVVRWLMRSLRRSAP